MRASIIDTISTTYIKAAAAVKGGPCTSVLGGFHSIHMVALVMASQNSPPKKNINAISASDVIAI